MIYAEQNYEQLFVFWKTSWDLIWICVPDFPHKHIVALRNILESERLPICFQTLYMCSFLSSIASLCQQICFFVFPFKKIRLFPLSRVYEVRLNTAIQPTIFAIIFLNRCGARTHDKMVNMMDTNNAFWDWIFVFFSRRKMSAFVLFWTCPPPIKPWPIATVLVCGRNEISKRVIAVTPLKY